MPIGMTFDEYVELKRTPANIADPAIRRSAERLLKGGFPMTLAQAAGHVRTRGYDCGPQALKLLVEQGVIKIADSNRWSLAVVDAAADYFEQCDLFIPYAEMCQVLGCTYGDFYRALREAAEQASETYGREVRVDDQLFVMHRYPPRGGDLVDGEFVGGHRALLSFTLCDDNPSPPQCHRPELHGCPRTIVRFTTGQLPASDLRQIEAGCAEVINEICRAMAGQPEVALTIRQLMQADDTESGLESLRRSNPAAAKRLVVAALAVLVNSINLVGIQDELQRRAREAN